MIEAIGMVAEAAESVETTESFSSIEFSITKDEADAVLENMLNEKCNVGDMPKATELLENDRKAFNPDEILKSWLSDDAIEGTNLFEVKSVTDEKNPIAPDNDISQNNDVNEAQQLIDGKENRSSNIKVTNYEQPTETDEQQKIRLPESHGHFESEPGNSKFIPDPDYTPPEKSRNPDKPYSNPDNLTMREILKKFGIDGVNFVNGFPDFSELSRGTVKIEGFETGGSEAMLKNFDKADKLEAEKRGCTPEEVRAWRKDNGYTWHECEDKTTMQKVPHEVHANIPHGGGRSQH